MVQVLNSYDFYFILPQNGRPPAEWNITEQLLPEVGRNHYINVMHKFMMIGQPKTSLMVAITVSYEIRVIFLQIIWNDAK